MNENKFFIRFGMHRDRAMLRFLKEEYSGIVLPAHILAYSSNATIAALRYIGKPYFIDSMTYIYAKGFLEGYKVRKEDEDHLKPSVIKLTADLGLSDEFPDIGAKPLEIDDFTEELIEKIAQGNVDLQLNRVNRGMESSTPKLVSLLAEIGQPPSAESNTFQPPLFVTTPYFLIPKEDSARWISVNVKLAQATKRLVPEGTDVRPIILTYVNILDKSLLDSYDGFNKFITWVEDLDESSLTTSDEQIKRLTQYRKFVVQANTDDRKIINLYGSYFSASLLKEGLEAFSNGPLYGEYKSSAASLGGIPPVRVYIPALHRFYIYSQAIELLNMYPAMFEGFPEGSKRLFNSVPELAKILGDVMLAQEHFINCRNQEIAYVDANETAIIADQLETTYNSVGPFDQKPLKGKEPKQLYSWFKALTAEIK